MRAAKNECGVCLRQSEEGIHLLSMWLCKECERAIVLLDVEDPEYDWYVERLRKSKMKLLLTH